MEVKVADADGNRLTRRMINPLHLDYVQQNVVRHISDGRTLLNCRLVSKDWNNYAMDSLKRHRRCGLKLTLNESSWSAYLKSIDAATSLGLENFNLHLEITHDPVKDQEQSTTIDKLLEYLENSASVRIISITILQFPVGRENSIRRLLRYAAPDLAHLDVSLIRLSTFDVDDPDLKFPSLFSISYDMRLVPAHGFVTQIIKRSPSLQRFKIESKSQNDWIMVSVSDLLNKPLQNAIGDLKLKVLEVPLIGENTTLENLGRIRLHELESLKLCANTMFDGQLIQTLNSNLRKMTSLELVLYDCANIYGLTLQKFPVSPTIKHFGLHELNDGFKFHPYLSYASCKDLTLAFLQIQQRFPNICSLGTDIEILQSVSRFYSNVRTWFDVTLAQRLTLRSVLTLAVDFAVFDKDGKDPPGSQPFFGISHCIRQVMPNMKTLVINILPVTSIPSLLYKDEEFGQFAQQLMGVGAFRVRELMQELLPILSGLHALEINNYYYDWMNEIWQDLTARERLRGLQELRLNRPRLGDKYFKDLPIIEIDVTRLGQIIPNIYIQ